MKGDDKGSRRRGVKSLTVNTGLQVKKSPELSPGRVWQKFTLFLTVFLATVLLAGLAQRRSKAVWSLDDVSFVKDITPSDYKAQDLFESGDQGGEEVNQAEWNENQDEERMKSVKTNDNDDDSAKDMETGTEEQQAKEDELNIAIDTEENDESDKDEGSETVSDSEPPSQKGKEEPEQVEQKETATDLTSQQRATNGSDTVLNSTVDNIENTTNSATDPTMLQTTLKLSRGEEVKPSLITNSSQPTGTLVPESEKDEANANPLLLPLPKRPCLASSDWYKSMPLPDECWNFNINYLKGYKTASSTLGGLARRMAARYGVNCPQCTRPQSFASPEPRMFANHHGMKPFGENGEKNGYESIHKVLAANNLRTFTWGFLRDPAERCLSSFYFFKVTRQGLEPSDERILRYARTPGCRNMIYRYYGLDVQDMRRKIDFFGLTERMNESLVVLAHVLNLSIGDMLFISSKVSTSKVLDLSRRAPIAADGSSTSVEQHHLVPHVPLRKQPQKVQSFFQNEFRELNAEEYTLYDEIGAQLDAAISKIGHDKFERRLNLFSSKLNAAQDHCSIIAGDGTLKEGTACYWQDNGCGYQCLDRFATEHDLWVPIPQL